MVPKKSKYNNLSVDGIFQIVDLVGIVIGLGLLTIYLGYWIKAYYDIEVLAEDFFKPEFWIMPVYFVVTSSFFLVSLLRAEKRRNSAMIGVFCWVFLYVVYRLFPKYLLVIILPFVVH